MKVNPLTVYFVPLLLCFLLLIQSRIILGAKHMSESRQIAEWVISYPGGEILLVGSDDNLVISGRTGLPEYDFEIRAIDIRDCNEKVREITSEELRRLGSLPSLKGLGIDRRYLPANALKIIGEMKNLEALSFNGEITSLEVLGGLKQLEFLDISGSNVGDEGLRGVDQLQSLNTLNVAECAIGDTALRSIAELHRLIFLDLSGTGVSDEGIAMVSQLPRLQYVRLRRTGVSDDGLQLLENHPTLRNVYAKDSRVSEKGAETLRRTLRKGAVVAHE